MTMVQIHPNSLILVKIIITEVTEKFSLEKLNGLASIVFFVRKTMSKINRNKAKPKQSQLSQNC